MGHFRSYEEAKKALKPIKETIGGKVFTFKPFPSVDYYERFQAWLQSQGERFDLDAIPQELVDALFLESLTPDEYKDFKSRLELPLFFAFLKDLIAGTGLVTFEVKEEAEDPNPPTRKTEKAPPSSKPSGSTSARSKQTSSSSAAKT